ncbi:MAG TPA: SDR family oxidoreductase [Gemmatimonadales bacterium]|nr:SDR family oxidoreductase [Gemmatimonadales bacterium]
MTLTDSTVVVTGGSMGIGLACAEELARAGARVVLCARGPDALADARSRVSQIPGAVVETVTADVTSESSLRRVFDAAQDLGGALHVVHAAAVLAAIGPVTEVDPETWLETVRTNLFGTFLTVRLGCRRMIASGRGGAIVCFSGGGASGPFPNYTAYAVGKVGVVRFVETVAQEVAAHRIRVNCVAPGFVPTRMHDATLQAGAAAGAAYLKRTEEELRSGGVPAERAAGTVRFLLSEEAAAITGKLVAAVHDDWASWPSRAHQIVGSDLFTLRRIVPRDRGLEWQ